MQVENKSLVWRGRDLGDGEERCSNNAQVEGDVEKCKLEVEKKTFIQ